MLDALSDDTFKGVHHLMPFDWAMLIPYFSVLIVLSIFGMHRYAMIRGGPSIAGSSPVSRPAALRRCRA